MSTGEPQPGTTTEAESRPAEPVPAPPQPPQLPPQLLVQLQPPQPPPPPPSGRDALWLFITLLNIGLFLLLIPNSIVESKTLALLIKIAPLLGGVMIAGYLWFAARFLAFLHSTSYKITQSVLLGVLLTLNASQLSIYPIYPRLEPPDAKLKVNGVETKYNGRLVRLPISNHLVVVSPPDETNQDVRQREFMVGYKDVFFSLFKGYNPRWGLLYKVTLDTQEPYVEIRVHKTDDAFDAGYLAAPPPTHFKRPFKRVNDKRDEFVYDAADEELGATDNVWLPDGAYTLTARKPGCEESDSRQLKVGSDSGEASLVTFKVLCETVP
jgi:hypothetical protein